MYLCHTSEYSQNALGLLNHGMNDKIQLHNQNNNLPDLRFPTITIRFSASYSQPLFITIKWCKLPSYKHFQFPSNQVCLFYPICHFSTAPFIIFHTSPKIEINSARWLLTLQSLCQTVFPWENIDFYPGAKPYFHLFTGRIFFCRKISTLLWTCANGRTKMEFSIMAIEEAPRLPAGYSTAAKLCAASPNPTSCHFFSFFLLVQRPFL